MIQDYKSIQRISINELDLNLNRTHQESKKSDYDFVYWIWHGYDYEFYTWLLFYAHKLSCTCFSFFCVCRAADAILLRTYSNGARSQGVTLFAIGIKRYNMNQLQVGLRRFSLQIGLASDF